MVNYWILKSEPDVYSLDNLEIEKIGRWDGVRNYQARNFIKKMKVGDLCFFYYSNCKNPGIYGLIEVTHEAMPDPLAFDPTSEYYDPRCTEENPRWYCVLVKLIKKYKKPLLLNDIRKLNFGDHPLTNKFNRLSVMPLTEGQYNYLNEFL